MIHIEQEPDRVPRGLIRSSGLAIVLMILASIGATMLLGRCAFGEAVRTAAPPPTNIETEAFAHETEAERLIRTSHARLARYGWVDRARGLVHVPLEVAIARYLAERAP